MAESSGGEDLTLQHVVVLGILFNMMMFHVRLAKPDILSALNVLRTWAQNQEVSRREKQKQLRVEEQMFQARLHNLRMASRFLVHLSMFAILVFSWRLFCSPSWPNACRVLVTSFVYGFDTLTNLKVVQVTTAFQWRLAEGMLLTSHAIFVLANATTDVGEFLALDRLSSLIFFVIAFVFMDSSVTVPVYCFEALLQFFRYSKLAGDLSSLQVYSALVSSVLIMVTIILLEQVMRASIRASLESGDASSLVLGFRRLLRGVCDGDLLLDQDFVISDDASGLEHLLKIQKLKDKNFLDLFLEDESREAFRSFVDTNSQQPMPRGLRVSLQGAYGPVSMDIFQTPIPALGPGHRVLAIKGDLDVPIPDALPGSTPVLTGPDSPTKSPLSPRSITSEVTVEAYEELVQVSFLVNNSGGLLDILEARIKFKRQSEASKLRLGMPTLRGILRPGDCALVERTLASSFQSRSSPGQRKHLKTPLLLRLLGEARASYVRARTAYVTLPEDTWGANAPSFWMKLKDFDPLPRELEGIRE